MLMKFRCNATFPAAGEVLAHFDSASQPGTRSIEMRLPKPGPIVGELYDLDLNGNGVPATAPAPAEATPNVATPDAERIQALTDQLNSVSAERDAARAEVEQVRKLLATPQQAAAS